MGILLCGVLTDSMGHSGHVLLLPQLSVWPDLLQSFQILGAVCIICQNIVATEDHGGERGEDKIYSTVRTIKIF